MFEDRHDAGRRLARRLERLRGQNLIVLGLPRGGVSVAAEVADALHAPLDVTVVRKLGAPDDPELALGAIGESETMVLDLDVIRLSGVSAAALAEVERRERARLTDQVRRYRGQRSVPTLIGRTVVIVDDGIATGATAKAACQMAQAEGASQVILAVPVAAADAVQKLQDVADEVISVVTPDQLFSIGEWYEDFTQVTDDEVMAMLAARTTASPAGPSDPVEAAFDGDVEVEADPARLPGRLTVPAGATGIVVFVHGSGSSRHSPRNTYVAGVLNQAGLATLLFDLLTPGEEGDRANVFDIDLLARRLTDTITWLGHRPATAKLPLGLFGASTGAAAALWAAAEPDSGVAAVVSRGGRPDLAASRLSQVTAPTLLIVGQLDGTVIRLNQAAQGLLHCEHDLVLVRGATHLFEEPGTLAVAAGLARDWFVRHLTATASDGRVEALHDQSR
jgi:putative phosphoribosyl transferase